MSASKIIQAYARKSLTKNQGSGIINLAGSMQSEAKAGEIVALLQRAGIPINQLDDYIRSETDLLKFLNLIKASNEPRIISGSSAEGRAITEKLFGKQKAPVVDINTGKTMDTSQGIMGGKSVKELMDSGKVQKGTDDIKISEKITDREMFKGANERFNETENFVTNTITKIKSMEPITAMKEANLIIGRKGKYKNLTSEESKKILTDTEDHIFERDIPIDPEDMAKGGRIGFSGGRGVMSILKNLFKPKPKKQETVKSFLEKRQFLKDMVGNTEKNKKARELKMLKDAMEEARKEGGFKFENVDIDKDIRPIFDKEIAKSLKKDRKLNATGGRAGLYTGGMVDVEPNLSDIGHGSDALMARTRLVSPDGQATTSTGLNYLLAEDNDNIRVPFENGGDMQGKIDEMIKHYQKYLKMPGKQKRKIPLKKFAEMFATENFADGGRIGFSDGKNFEMYLREREGIEKNQNMKRLYEEYLEDMRRKKVANQKQMVADGGRIGFSGGGGMSKRAFLKLLATLTGGAAAVKSGIIGLGEGTTKKAVTETVKKAAGSGEVPPYFFKLVEKIKALGDDTLATKDKAIAKKYKDYTMEEDFAGNIEIIKKERGGFREDVFMSYKVDDVPIKGKKGSKKVEEYEEFTAKPDQDGKMKNIEQGVPDSVVMEVEAGSGNVPEFFYTGPNPIKKADGGRIGFSAGSLARLGINSTSRRFLEKVFGKEKFATMIENDPRMHRGMLEVVEMFRNKDKEGLKKYMQKFLPDMDDATVEDFIVGGKGSEGIEGQLIRLGSGREYKNLIDMKKEADQIRKLDDFDIDGVSKNAEGGRIGFSGGGIFRAIIAKAAAKKGMKPYEFIKVTSYKSLPPEVKMFLSAEDFARLKSGQQEMYTNYIDMAKTRKNFQEQVEGGKATPAKPLFEHMEKTMDKQSYVPKNVTSDDIAEMELMVKNRFNKGRKDNAQGGLQTMLGE